MSKEIKPIGARVLLKPIQEQDQTKGGIIIPDSAKEKPQEAEVLAVGTGARNEKGELIPFAVKKGDRVLFSKYGGTEVKVEGHTYMVMREDDLLAILS